MNIKLYTLFRGVKYILEIGHSMLHSSYYKSLSIVLRLFTFYHTILSFILMSLGLMICYASMGNANKNLFANQFYFFKLKKRSTHRMEVTQEKSTNES